MRPKQITTAVLSNDANGICVSQTTSGAANLSLNGALVSSSVASAAEPQIVSITGTGDNSGITFTIYGSDADGKTTTEVVTGANAGTAKSSKYFKSITRIAASAAVTGNVEIGWMAADGMATLTIVSNHLQVPFNMAVNFDGVVSGMTATCQYSMDNPIDGNFDPYQETATWNSITGLSGVTADANAAITFPIRAVRLVQTTGTTTATCRLTVIQGGSL